MQGITASIVLYNNNPLLVQLVIKQAINPPLITKLYLIDNSPTDTLKTLASHPKIEYIFNNRNIGFGAAHNIAIKKALPKSKYHIVLNPDVYFTDDVVEQLFNYMEGHPDAGLVAPKIKYPNGDLQYACKLLPAPADLISRRFLPASFIKRRMYRFEMRQTGYNKIMQAPYLPGCFMFLRMEALQKVGLFDERFFMYPEDIDLTRRIHKHYQTVFYPYVEITHAHERGSYKSFKLLIVHIVNMIRYFNKWGWFFDRERKEINNKTLAQFA